MPNQNTSSGQLAQLKQPRHDKSFQIIDKFCTRPELAEVLGVSDDGRVVRLVDYLLSTNKGIQRRSLAKLAQMCDLSYAELLKAMSNARVAEGLLRMGKHIPEVMEDVAVDAKSKQVPCRDCKGTGEVIARRTRGQANTYKTCWACQGSGTIRQIGNAHARDLVYETIGMTNRKSPLFNVNVGVGSGVLPSTESEMGAIDKVLQLQPVNKTKGT